MAETFERRDNVLHCEELPLPELVARWGTPLYVYSATAIRLREISVAYQWQRLRVGLTGNNLFYFLLNAPFDPEQVAGVNPVGVGVDVFGLPMSSSFGITLKYSY